MKSILVFDFLFVREHRTINLAFINALCLSFKVTVLSGNGYYDENKNDFSKKGINTVDIIYKNRTGKIGTRLQYLKIASCIKKVFRKNEFDLAVCLGFDTTVMPYQKIRSVVNNNGIFLVHHRNIDELTSRFKSLCFSLYKNQVHHLVFESFFATRLIEKGVSPNNVFVVPHPVDLDNSSSDSSIYDCVGLCNSNDETFIDDIIAMKEDFLKSNLKIVLRTKKKRIIDCPNISFIDKYLERKTYNELLNKAKCIFVPLPKTYIYRLSGSIYDALSRKKVVITTSKYYYEEYAKRYPGLCYFANNANLLLDFLNNHKGIACNSNSLSIFLKDHSIDELNKSLKESFKTFN